jgi:ankyrin repeat protein
MIKPALPTRRLPARPDLTQLKHQAKELLDRYLANEPEALSEVDRFYPNPPQLTLQRAQHVLARSYGYDSWSKLKAYVDGATGRRLVEAARAGDVEQARALLQQRPELVGYSLEGYTSLHVAVQDRRPDLVRLLMQFGADPHLQFYPRVARSSPLELAADRGYDDIVTILREGEKRPTPPEDNFPDENRAENPARAAVISGDTGYLRANQASLIAPQDDHGWLLAVAVDQDRPDMLQLLLDFGLDPDARVQVEDDGEITLSWGMPLYQCTRYRKHDMARMLLERGADPNGQVYASGTPLSEAYGQGDDEMVALLERYGGKSNASMAGLYRRPDLAQRLLEEHGDTVLPDDGFAKGTVAEQLLGAAARGGDPRILEMALSRVSIPLNDPRWHGVLRAPLGFWNHWTGPWCHLEWDRTTYLTCFRMILAHCTPAILRGRAGTTILHDIANMGNHVRPEERVAFAAAALDAGAPLDVRDDLLQSTPLGWACHLGREELVEFFLERGADPVEAGAPPWATPLEHARKQGHRAIIERLSRP